jgi:hypothetical protein
MEQNSLIVIAAVVVVVVVALVAWLGMRRHRTQRLEQLFGPEYDRTVGALGERAKAEKELEARAKRVEELHLHPLAPAQRDGFQGRWLTTQAGFVDSPPAAVAQADELVAEVMRARGYPVAEFEQQAADLSVDHPRFVDNYRRAHALAGTARDGQASTEDLRQAMVHYRELFEDLLEVAEPELQPA